MKRRLASLFRWLEDHLDPSRRDLVIKLQAEAKCDRRAIESFSNTIDKLARQVDQLTDETAPVLPPTIAPDWLPEHQAALRAFLLSPAGLVLLHRGRFIHFETAKKANADLFHTTHSSGLADGWGKAMEWIQSLSRTSRAPDDSPTGDNKSENYTAPNGESELRELMSP